MKKKLIILLIFIGIMFTFFGIFKKNADLDSHLDLETLHTNTVTTFVNDAPSTYALFDNNTKVLLPETGYKTQKLFFIDLKTKSKKEIKIPTNAQLSSPTFYPVDNQALISFNVMEEQGAKGKVFSVNASGEIKELETLDLVLYIQNNYSKIEQEAQKLDDLIQNNTISQLTKIQTTFFNNQNQSETVPGGFFNENYFIRINGTNTRDLPKLNQLARQTITNNYTQSPQYLIYKNLSIQIQKNQFESFAGIIDNRNITNITITKNGEIVKTFNFKSFYYDVVLLDNTLFIVGQNIKFLDLETLN